MSFVLAACSETLFLDLPFEERVSRIHELGFQVELWGWPHLDIAALRATGAAFSTVSGYVSGNLTDPDRIEVFLESAKRSLEIADQLDCPRLNVHGSGLGSGGLPEAPKWSTSGSGWLRAADTLHRLAELGVDAGRVFTLENLNTRLDHPGTQFATSEETAQLVQAVDSPGLRMNLDLYHAQIDEGNLIERTIRMLPWLEEIQVADVPGRMEPGTGEIDYSAIARALDDAGYQGVIGLEAYASGDPAVALERFRSAFTVE